MMMRTAVPVFLALAVVLASGCVQNAPSGDAGPSGDSMGGKTYTLEEVSLHSSADDCWMAVHGKVYDATSFVSSHPGGEAILQGCGEDATTLFDTRPMGSGTPHSPRADSIHEGLYLGDLAG